MKPIIRIVGVIIMLTTLTAHASAQINNTLNQADSLVSITLKVKGITCSMDLNMISANVEKLTGVQACKPSKQGTTTSFIISYRPSAVSDKEIIKVIEGTGSCENPDERPYKVKQ
jgi:copper chaperone CopZ